MPVRDVNEEAFRDFERMINLQTLSLQTLNPPL